MAKLITVYWRDIPSQVIAQAGRKRVKQVLGERFQKAIDRAAMRAGKGSSDLYLEEWRRLSRPCGVDIEDEIRSAAQALESQFDDRQLERLVKSGGRAEALSEGA